MPAIGKNRYLPVLEMICPEPIETDEQPGHQREQVHPGDGRRDAPDDLEERGQVGDRAEHREADDEADQAGHREGAQLEQVQRQDRLGGPPLDQHEHADQQHAGHAQDVDRRRPPRVGGAAQAGQQDQRGGGRDSTRVPR